MPGSADAAVCTGGTLTTPCTMLGTATLTGGVLTLTSPTTLTSPASINGTAQSVVDALPTDSRRAPHRHRLLSLRPPRVKRRLEHHGDLIAFHLRGYVVHRPARLIPGQRHPGQRGQHDVVRAVPSGYRQRLRARAGWHECPDNHGESERLVGQHPGERRHRGLHLDHHDDHCLGAMMRGCC